MVGKNGPTMRGKHELWMENRLTAPSTKTNAADRSLDPNRSMVLQAVRRRREAIMVRIPILVGCRRRVVRICNKSARRASAREWYATRSTSERFVVVSVIVAQGKVIKSNENVSMETVGCPAAVRQPEAEGEEFGRKKKLER